MKRAVMLVVVVVAGGCETTAQRYENYLWVRTDGRAVSGDAALEAQAQVDRTVCIGDVQKSAVAAPPIYYQGMAGAISAAMIADQRFAAYVDILKGCMAARGYVLVPKSEADAVAAKFAAAANAT